MRKTVQIESLIKKEFPKLPLTQHSLRLISTYLDLLSQWNRKINLTAIRDKDAMLVKHVFDALTFFQLRLNYPDADLGSGNILDLGSGGGLPGIILAICDPKIQLVSVDKSKKKIAFQEHVALSLKLNNVTPIHSRLEDLAEIEVHKTAYDLIVSRAFDQIKSLFYFADLFLKPKANLVLWKGQRWKEEMNQISDDYQQRYQIINCHEYQFPSHNHGGVLLFINKH